jgi:hypothetical protein
MTERQQFSNELAHQPIKLLKQKNSGALFRKRAIPTERPPFVGEVSAIFSG